MPLPASSRRRTCRVLKCALVAKPERPENDGIISRLNERMDRLNMLNSSTSDQSNVQKNRAVERKWHSVEPGSMSENLTVYESNMIESLSSISLTSAAAPVRSRTGPDTFPYPTEFYGESIPVSDILDPWSGDSIAYAQRMEQSTSEDVSTLIDPYEDASTLPYPFNMNRNSNVRLPADPFDRVPYCKSNYKYSAMISTIADPYN